MTYEIVKALHIVSIIAWMAGLLYLPRLMVYHTEAAIGSDKSETFKVMERRLLKAIMNPAMIAAWVFGFWLVHLADYWTDGWMLLKFSMVLVLTVVHHWLARLVRAFAEDRNTRTTRFYRVLNEVPTIAMIVIVFAVILKPF